MVSVWLVGQTCPGTDREGNHTMKSLLSFSVIVPSKSVKKMYLGFLKGQFIALSSDADDAMLGEYEMGI